MVVEVSKTDKNNHTEAILLALVVFLMGFAVLLTGDNLKLKRKVIMYREIVVETTARLASVEATLKSVNASFEEASDGID